MGRNDCIINKIKDILLIGVNIFSDSSPGGSDFLPLLRGMRPDRSIRALGSCIESSRRRLKVMAKLAFTRIDHNP